MCNWHRNFLQGIYDAWFLADLAYGAIYTGNIIAKNRLKQGKKEHPMGLPWDVLYSWRRRRDYFAGAASPGKICAYAQTGVRPSAFLRRFEPLAPGFESTLSNTIKNTPHGRDFLLWRRRRDSNP